MSIFLLSLSEWIVSFLKIVVSEAKNAPRQCLGLAAYLPVVMDTGRNNEVIIWLLFFLVASQHMIVSANCISAFPVDGGVGCCPSW